MTRYNLPDEGSQQWYSDPLYPAVADLDRRVGVTESLDQQQTADIAAAAAAAYLAQETANTAQETADLAARVYRQPTKPWPDGDPAHADDVGDLWFDTTGDPIKLPVLNPGFEVDTSGWSSWTELTRDTTQAHSGSASGKVVVPDQTYGTVFTIPLLSASSGTRYTASVWLKGNAGGEDLHVELLDDAGGPPVGSVASVTLTTSWQQVTITGYTGGYLPHGLYLLIGNNWGSWPITWFVDDVVIEGPPGVLTDEATPYYWTGSEWAEISDSAIADAQAAADAAQAAANTAQATADAALDAASYHHVQATVSATWSIQHNLGYRPNVTVQDSAGSSWEGDVTYDDNNHLTIRFSAAFSGVADLS